MDAATTTLMPASSLASEVSTTGVEESGPKEFVSLRPGGGGGRFSFRFGPTSGGTAPPTDSSSGSTSQKAQGFLSSNRVFPSRLDKQSRSSKPREEVTRYSKEVLLGFKEDWTTLPEEIAGSDVQRTGSTMFEEFGRREQTYQPERTSEPDLRNWRERTPLPAPPPEERPRERDQYRERPGAKENRAPNDRQNDRQSNVQENRRSDNPQPAMQSGPGPAIAKAANPWSARRGAQTEKEKVIKTVKGIMNKLTPEKYEVLLQQLIEAGITTSEILQDVISLVFDKSVLEPTFCPMYAELCVDLSKALPEFASSEPGEKPVTFRRVLLNTCQSEFEGADALRAEIRQMTAPEQEQLRKEKERNVKLRTLGNIKFIGELFKQKMIPEKIVHACIHELLGPDPKAVPAEENVEALCQLLSTVGKEIEANEKSRTARDSYFSRLEELGHSSRLPSRIRFMVRDILDVRANNWVPRREEVKAKTINEIHAEAEMKLGLRSGAANYKVGRAGAGVQGGMIPGGGMMPGMPGTGRPGAMMPGMPGIGSNNFGPTAHFMDGEGWEIVNVRQKTKREPVGMAPNSGTSAASRLPIPGMRSSTVNARNLPQGSSSLFMGRPSALLGNSAPVSAPVSAVRNGPSVVDAAPRAVPSAAPVVETAAKVQERETPSATATPSSKSSTDVNKKTESLLTEYFSIVDQKEALLCVKELGGSDVHPQFVVCTLKVVFEKRDREADLVAKLFEYLHSEKVVSGDSLKAGALLAAEELEDLAMDAPLAPKLMAKMLAGFVRMKASDASLLIEVCKKVEDEDLRRVLFIASLKALQVSMKDEQLKSSIGSLSLETNLSVLGLSDRSDLLKFLKGEGLDGLAAFL